MQMWYNIIIMRGVHFVLSFGLALLAAAGLILSGAHSIEPSVEANTPQTVRFTVIPNAPNPEEIFSEVNQVRLQYGLKPLLANGALATIAEQRAKDMSERRYYAHKNPDGKYFDDLLVAAHIYNQYACENLDLEFTISSETYVADWLNSKHGHRECLLSPAATEAGYAVAPFMTATNQGEPMRSYVVVGIHASPQLQQISVRL
jgi:uncharacterized protein YkwD